MARGKRRTRGEAEHERLLRRGTDDHYQDVELYDFEYSDRDNDVAWYVRFADEHRGELPILELGAGSGRVCCPLARAGHRVIALDRMDTMLATLRRRLKDDELGDAVEVVAADMREIPLDDASVGTVLAPFNALMHLYTWRDLLACFRDVRRVLTPGGTFAFDVELPDLEWLGWEEDERHAVTAFKHPRTGERMIYSTNHRYDPDTQICHIRIFYDDAPAPGRRFDPPSKPRKLVHLAHRQIFPEELRLLIHAAGLELASHTGDFEDVALGPGVQSQVVVCTRPSA